MVVVQILLCCLLCSSVLSKVSPYSFQGNILSEQENDKLQATCGIRPQNASSFKSLFGRQLLQGDAPWAVSINYAINWNPEMEENEIGSTMFKFCSGTLISPRHVLTAGHCVGVKEADCDRLVSTEFEMKNIGRWRVYLGGSCANPKSCLEQNRPERLVGRRVARAYLPSYYTEDQCESNIDVGDAMVLELDEDVPIGRNIFPACLAASPPVLDEPLTVIGFGGDDGQDPWITTEQDVLKISRETVTDCRKAVPKDTFCTLAEQTIACAGDSGGGLVRQESSGRITVAGMVSSGPGCGAVLENQEQDGPVWTISLQTNAWKQAQWICLTTGICREPDVTAGIIRYLSLPAKSSPILAVEIGPVPYEEMFI